MYLGRSQELTRFCSKKSNGSPQTDKYGPMLSGAIDGTAVCIH